MSQDRRADPSPSEPGPPHRSLLSEPGPACIDALSGFGGAKAGLGQRPLIKAALLQLRQHPYPLDADTLQSGAPRPLTTLLSEAAPRDLNHVWFTTDGASAMDMAMRAVTLFNTARKQPHRKHVIAFERSYHGNVGAAAGLTGIDWYHTGFDLPAPTQHHLPSPYPYRHPVGPDPKAVLAATVQAFHDKLAEIGAGDVAALVCEPVQCAGGVIVPPQEFLRAMREACNAHGILMIVDEGASAFRMSGMHFACVLDGISPDMLTIGDALTLGYLPLGAVLVSDRMSRTLYDAAPRGLPPGPAAHPVSLAVAREAMTLLQGGLLRSSGISARKFQDGLRGFADHPLVGEVRGRGLLGAVEMVRDKRSKARLTLDVRRNRQISQSEGLMLKVFPDGVLGLTPPLSITPPEVDKLLGRLGTILDRIQTEGRNG